MLNFYELLIKKIFESIRGKIKIDKLWNRNEIQLYLFIKTQFCYIPQSIFNNCIGRAWQSAFVYQDSCLQKDQDRIERCAKTDLCQKLDSAVLPKNLSTLDVSLMCFRGKLCASVERAR